MQSQVHQLSPSKNQMAHSMWVIWGEFSKGTFCEDVYRVTGNRDDAVPQSQQPRLP